VKTKIAGSVAGALLAAAALGPAALEAAESKITVLNPRGAPPPIRLVPMAPRLDTLDGKTVYVIGVSFIEPVTTELFKLLQERYPKTTWIRKDKGGSFFDDAPQLWEEVKAKGDAAVLTIGH